MAATINTGVSRTAIEDKLKKFDNIITVAKTGYADFVCSDSTYTSDDQCIQAAIDSLPSTGGNIYINDDGQYKISATITNSGKSDVHIYGHATLVRAASLMGSLFSTTNGTTGTHRIINAIHNVGDKILTLASTADFTVGSPVYIMELGTTEYDRVDIIEAVTSTTITLQTGIKWGTISGTSFVAPIAGMSSGIIIDGLKITDEATESIAKSPVISLRYVLNSKLQNLEISNVCGSGIYTIWSKNIHMRNILIDGVIDDTLGYGIDINHGSNSITISDSIINGTRHATTGNSSSDITISNVIANGCTTYANTAHSFDTHPYMIDITYINCISNGAVGGLHVRGKRVTVSNFILNTLTNGAIRIDEGAKHVEISNIQVFSNGSWAEYSAYGIISVDDASYVTISQLRVMQYGGSISTLPIYAIYLSTCDKIKISNFYIEDSSGTTITSGVSTNNVCDNLRIRDGAFVLPKTNAKSIYIRESCTDAKFVDIETVCPIYDATGTATFENVSSYVNEKTSTATIAASASYVTVTHGMAATPTKIIVTPFGNVGNCWITDAGATTFKINVSSAPASDTLISWSAEI